MVSREHLDSSEPTWYLHIHFHPVYGWEKLVWMFTLTDLILFSNHIHNVVLKYSLISIFQWEISNFGGAPFLDPRKALVYFSFLSSTYPYTKNCIFKNCMHISALIKDLVLALSWEELSTKSCTESLVFPTCFCCPAVTVQDSARWAFWWALTFGQCWSESIGSAPHTNPIWSHCFP